MLEQQEKLWDFSAVEAGQAGNSTVVQITPENILEYALVAQNQEYSASAVAMPTMVLTYAPLLRDDIAAASGFVALEESRWSRQQTPFAKCEIRWSGAVRAGDTLTSTRNVLEKYERRGSKFVTFRVESSNQHADKVAEYDYTCIFEYAGGQKQEPQGRGSTAPQEEAARPAKPERRLVNFDNIAVGDQLASLDITESQEIISLKNDLRLAGKPSDSNIHTDEEFAKQNIFGGLVNSGPATMSYVDQMLQLSFPLSAFYEGGRLLIRAIEPFRAGDTVTFHGEITGVQAEAHKKMVECRIKGTNQRGDLVSLSDATLVLTR